MIWSAGLAICVLVLLSELTGIQPVEQPGITFCWTVTLCLVPVIWGALIEKLAWRGPASPGRFVMHSILIRYGVLAGRGFWFACGAGIVMSSGWPQLVRGNLGLAIVPLVDEFLIACPIAFSGMLSGALLRRAAMIAERNFDEPMDIDVSRGLAMFGPRLRIASGLVVVPAALMFLARDLFGLFIANPGPLAVGVWGVATVIFLAGIYPSLASSMWQTIPLPGGDLEERMSREADTRCLARIPVRAWLTNQQVINGVVIGLFPWNRRVLLTDGLLQQFDEREVLAIFRHELGHVAGGHMWIRMLVLTAPILFFCVVSALQGNVSTDGSFPDSISTWCSLAVALMLVLLFWLLIATPVFRHCEILADRFAVQDERGIPSEELADDYCSAMLRMAALNPHQWERGTILHPSLRSRVDAVYRYALPHLAKHVDHQDIG